VGIENGSGSTSGAIPHLCWTKAHDSGQKNITDSNENGSGAKGPQGQGQGKDKGQGKGKARAKARAGQGQGQGGPNKKKLPTAQSAKLGQGR